jgi:hypothetical protein
MKYAIKIAALSILIIAFAGCDQEASYFTDTPIIESYLHPGDYLNVTVSRQTPFLSEAVYSDDDIDNLTIQAEANGEMHTLTPLGDGKYIAYSLVGTEGTQYNLTFRFNSKDVYAYTIIPSKPANVTQSATEMYRERIDFSAPPNPGAMPDPIEILWDNPDRSYYLITVENIEETPDPIADFGGDLPERFLLRPPVNTSSAKLSAMQFQYFGTHRVILHHLLPDYAALFNDNNISSQNLTNPSTSIINGYGIFTGLNSDTLYVEVIEE